MVAPAARRLRADELYAEVTTASPYAALNRDDFDAVVDFVATGGYALKAYERFARIRQGKDGLWRVANPRVVQRYRMNVGTIVEADMLKVRLVRSRARNDPAWGRLLGEVEEYFIETTGAGRHFCVLRRGAQIRGAGRERSLRLAHHCGGSESAGLRGRQISALDLSRRPRARHHRRSAGLEGLPTQVGEWLEIQQWRSQLPGRRELLVETFPRANNIISSAIRSRAARASDARHAVDAPPRTRPTAAARFRRQRICARGVGPWRCRAWLARGELSLGTLFDEDMLGDDLEAWLAESALMKRTFRNCAIIAGLIDRRFPGEENRAAGDDLDRPRL